MTRLGFWYNVTPLDAFATQTAHRKSSRSHSNSTNRMQRSIFSNTVYKNSTGEIRVSPATAKTGLLQFVRHNLVRPSSRYETNTHGKKKYALCRFNYCTIKIKRRVLASAASDPLHPNGGFPRAALFVLTDVRKMSNFDQMSPAEIARHERRARRRLRNPWIEACRWREERDGEGVRWYVVFHAQFSSDRVSVVIHGEVVPRDLLCADGRRSSCKLLSEDLTLDSEWKTWDSVCGTLPPPPSYLDLFENCVLWCFFILSLSWFHIAYFF